MKPIRLVVALFLLLGLPHCSFAQSSKGQFSGSLDANTNFFLRDDKIGAVNTPQYDDQLIGIESWLTLKYRIGDFDFGMRLDAFSNSNLLNPNDAYSDAGLGRIYATWRSKNVEVTGGHFYDQIGSGLIFRAYEERALLIDNAMFGLRTRWNISDAIQLAGFGGKQKDLFGLHESVIIGGRIEGFIADGESNWSLSPGVGIITKTFSEKQVDGLSNVISTYTPEDFIESIPFHNLAAAYYHTLQSGNVTWYFEGAYKSRDVFFDTFSPRSLWTGGETTGKFVLEEGFVVFNSLAYAHRGFGLSAEYKITSNFNYRADAFATLNRAFVNFLPPMTRFNTYRLTARYSPATQELGEFATQVELTYRPNNKRDFLLNASYVNDANGTALYREIFSQLTIKKVRKSTLTGGVQLQWYNQQIYEGKAGVPMVKTITPYIDFVMRIDKTKAVRTELQYMYTKQDWGSWLFGLVEFSIAPHWVIELSDMWNVVPYVGSDGIRKNDPLHFPTAGLTYSIRAHRLSARFVKQVEGVVCSGGVCRLEPAFSGMRLQLASQF